MRTLPARTPSRRPAPGGSGARSKLRAASSVSKRDIIESGARDGLDSTSAAGRGDIRGTVGPAQRRERRGVEADARPGRLLRARRGAGVSEAGRSPRRAGARARLQRRRARPAAAHPQGRNAESAAAQQIVRAHDAELSRLARRQRLGGDRRPDAAADRARRQSRHPLFAARRRLQPLFPACRRRCGRQISGGLFGPIVVEEPSPPAVDLETIVVLSDWRLDPSGQIADLGQADPGAARAASALP